MLAWLKRKQTYLDTIRELRTERDALYVKAEGLEAEVKKLKGEQDRLYRKYVALKKEAKP